MGRLALTTPLMVYLFSVIISLSVATSSSHSFAAAAKLVSSILSSPRPYSDEMKSRILIPYLIYCTPVVSYFEKKKNIYYFEGGVGIDFTLSVEVRTLRQNN